ncbi:Hybrid signal transduction histidine kinase K [Lachnellula occidentalis]|uniref:histidine kinase n=1 Tax=Lachnellula occidentalis TaxID=215460 RepID=A0A8H8S0P4_9HELO|nr:Hybrid signal transduction histidine kinase K [Lachnellula occidentalis]
MAVADANNTDTDTDTDTDLESDQRQQCIVPSPTSPLFHPEWETLLPSTDHIRFFASVDWAASPLGPLSTWDAALRLQTFAVMSDSQAGCLYWGPQKVAIYNEAFVPLAGKAHPMLMGLAFEVGFPEIWPQIKVVFEAAEVSGLAGDVYEIELFVERNHFMEEAFFTGNFNPIRGFSSKVEGFYNTVHEVTKQKITQRRTTLLNRMVGSTRLHSENYPALLMTLLAEYERDISMALLYEIDDYSVPGSQIVNLRGQIAVPQNHPIAPKMANLHNSMEGIIPCLRQAQDEIIDIPVDNKFADIPWRGFSEGSRCISILPFFGGGKLLGFLVVGANPRRPIDDDHHQFMRDLASKVSSIANSVVSVEEAQRRAEQLEKKLEDSDKKIRHMAQNATIGMLRLSVDGRILWANDQYYELTGKSIQAVPQRFQFLDSFLGEDLENAVSAWNRLSEGEEKVSVELRLKKMFIPPIGEPEPGCITSTSFPYKEDGRTTSFMMYMSEISALKWAEQAEARKAEDAFEAKKQQEEFIDIVSHEMRNPLAAILMSADSITKSMAEVREREITEGRLLVALHSNVDSANTIVKCANHQKRIVDDVLTLSKLQYMMLAITPEPTQVQELVDSTLKMFESDLQEKKITATASAENERINADWVSCDPSRLTQIIVNFLTNAIKFTKDESRRDIRIKYGIATSEPRAAFRGDITWAPVDSTSASPRSSLDPDPGQLIYLTFSVEDSGVGMDSVDMQNLFSRFTQANTKTSIKYGGSGLGLFICKRLAEKMGGEIGVVSTKGNGSTFVFYIEAHRAVLEENKPSAVIEFPFPPRPKSSQAGSKVPLKLDLSNIQVLLVEDNVVNQTILAKQLIKAGCTVTIANHGLEALERLRETRLWHENLDGKKLDIVLMDWEMPVMDGLTCTKEIRMLERTGQLIGHVEIIATTANARSEQLQKALESGIDSVISKPFLVNDLLKQMRERLSKVNVRAAPPRVMTS